MHFFNSSLIPTQLCPESLRALYVRSHPRWATTELCNFSKMAEFFCDSTSESLFWAFIISSSLSSESLEPVSWNLIYDSFIRKMRGVESSLKQYRTDGLIFFKSMWKILVSPSATTFWAPGMCSIWKRNSDSRTLHLTNLGTVELETRNTRFLWSVLTEKVWPMGRD